MKKAEGTENFERRFPPYSNLEAEKAGVYAKRPEGNFKASEGQKDKY